MAEKTRNGLIKVTDRPEISNLDEHPGLPDVHAIEFKGVTFSYGGKTQALADVSLDVHRGTFTTILGPNGSGKSTLVKVLMKENSLRSLKARLSAALRRRGSAEGEKASANGGAVFVNGRDVRRLPAKAFGKLIAYLPQLVDIPEGLSVQDFVSFGRIPHLGLFGIMTAKDKRAVASALARLELTDLRHRDMRQLSGGQRQKAMIALALAQETPIVVVDEPTTFMDIKNQHEILDILSGLHLEGKTILAILHDINQAAQYSDYVAVLKNGRNYSFGVPSDVINARMLSEVYGVKAQMMLFEGRRYVADIRVERNEAKGDPAEGP